MNELEETFCCCWLLVLLPERKSETSKHMIASRFWVRFCESSSHDWAKRTSTRRSCGWAAHATLDAFPDRVSRVTMYQCMIFNLKTVLKHLRRKGLERTSPVVFVDHRGQWYQPYVRASGIVCACFYRHFNGRWSPQDFAGSWRVTKKILFLKWQSSLKQL